MTTDIYNYWLSNIYGIGPIKIGELLEIFGCVEEIYRADYNQLKSSTTLREKDIEALINSRDYDKLSKDYEKLVKDGISIIAFNNPQYPDRLKNIHAAPFALYVKGKLPTNDMKLLAIVGARECTEYGVEVTKYITRAVARENIAIISGLARGIDSYAHMGALQAGGITYGVLGCGIDICYPRENISLYMEMQKRGAVISEYAPGISPIPGNFPMRNRIIGGLSDGILVIEAREKSGSLITADMGLEQGKNIYAIPGRITDNLSSGTNNLIKMGAKLVSSPYDILEDLLTTYVNSNDKNQDKSIALDPVYKKIYETLSLSPMHIEEIAKKTRFPIEMLMEKLLELELMDLISQTMKNWYIRGQSI